MEDEKLTRLYDTLAKLAPKGKAGGLGLSHLRLHKDSHEKNQVNHFGHPHDATLPNNPLYTRFVRAGSGIGQYHKHFDRPENSDNVDNKEEEGKDSKKKKKKDKKEKKEPPVEAKPEIVETIIEEKKKKKEKKSKSSEPEPEPEPALPAPEVVPQTAEKEKKKKDKRQSKPEIEEPQSTVVEEVVETKKKKKRDRNQLESTVSSSTEMQSSKKAKFEPVVEVPTPHYEVATENKSNKKKQKKEKKAKKEKHL